jgi:DNA-binding LacI/PurR family transcriptional regulator
MQDIASIAGVSRSTVSRILSDAPLTVPVAAETRARVLAVAREVDYRPNPLARALHGAPTMLLGAIVRDITDPFFSGAIEAVSQEARARGYNIVLGHAHAQANEAFALATVLEARQCDAILLLGDMGDQPRLLEDLRSTHIPVVALWQSPQLDLIPGVNVDNHAGIVMAMEHLHGLGHRRIAFVGGRPLGDIRERRVAYTDAVTAILGDLPRGYLQAVPTNLPADGEAAAATLLRLTPRPTAVVTATDTLAIGVLRGALTAGLRLPDELSVVGFDDIPMASFTVPALTTVRMPMAQMVAAAVERAIAGEPATSAPVPGTVFRPRLVVRESTGPCPEPAQELTSPSPPPPG